MKKMRFLLIAILCLLSVFSFSFSVYADEVKYYIEPLKMSIKIPDTMSVKTTENSSDLQQGIYLEAVNSDKTLSITISMVSDEKTQQAKSLMEMSSSAIEEFKENIESDGYSSGADSTYGGIPFLDFTKTGDTNIIQSITIVNGMIVTIVSQSPSDAFTTDEIALLKSCLESIRFDNLGVAEKKVTFWGVILWIFIIIIILGIAFILLSFYMSKRNADRKRAIREEKNKKANYDVLKQADINRKRKEHAQKVGGYKTSADYFDNDFDSSVKEISDTLEQPPVKPAPTAAEKAVKTTKNAVTHMGYFFKNLKKEMGKNKSGKNKGISKKGKTKVRDYDIFNDR